MAIAAREGPARPFLNAFSEILVLGHVSGTDSDPHWASERIRRSEVYRARRRHLELITDEGLRAALAEGRGGPQ